MCGIVGYVGKNIKLDYFYKKLKLLEYRGYDSCGVSFLEKDHYKIIKRKGHIEGLKNILKRKTSDIIIGHTRWATHGNVSKLNAHPHFSEKFIIVHNGIINNYLQLKEKWNLKTKTNTDTEIIALLLDKIYGGNIKDTLIKLDNLLSGTYAILLINKEEKDKIYFMKNSSSLYLAIGTSAMLASDISALNDYQIYYSLNDHSIGYITYNNYYLFLGDVVKQHVNDNVIPTIKKSKYYMLDEIYDIKKVIRVIQEKYFINKTISINDDIFKLIDEAPEIHFIGCGSSYNAGLIGAYYFNMNNKKAFAHIASEFLYNPTLLDDKSLLIYLSQSGETKDVISVYEKHKSYKSICIVNNINSTLALNINYKMCIYSGLEMAVAATKTYAAQVIVLFILAFKNDSYNYIEEIVKAIDSVYYDKLILRLSKKIKNKKRLFLIGRGIDYLGALEGALKIKEVAYINANAYPSGELKHGPLALINKHDCTLLFITNKDNKVSLINLKETLARGSAGYIFDTNRLKTNSSNPLLVILNVVICDLLSYYIALKKGYSIDKPNNLAKSVTVE